MNEELISDLLISALEGGSNYWYYLDLNFEKDFEKYRLNPSDSATDCVIQGILSGGEQISVYDIESPDEFLGLVSKEKIEEAATLMKNNYTSHYADAINENWDAETADVFFQLIVMGEIIYG